MCTGLEIAALASAVGGTAAGAAGQASAVKRNANAQRQQTELSAEEFNKRNTLANEIFKENTDVSRQVYDELAALSDDEFAQRTGLSKDAFSQLNEIERQQIIRDAAAADANIAAGRDARLTRDAERDAASAEYAQTLQGANERQSGYRSQADAIAAELLAAFSPEAMATRRAEAMTGRNAAVSRAVSPTAVRTVNDPVIQAAFERYSRSGRDEAARRSGAMSRAASYGDSVATGDRMIDRGNEHVAFIRDAATRTLAPLGAQLDTSSLKYNNAAARARDRGTAADADLAAALGLSSTQAQGESRPVVSYTGAMDDALASFFGGRNASAAGRGNTLIGANEARLQGSNAVSQNYESGINNVTQFRMANQGPSAWSTLGTFSSALSPTFFGMATKDPNSTGFGFNKPKATVS